MEKQVIAGCVDTAKEYLDGIGKSLSPVQLHELTARVLGYKNRHVMAGQSTGDKPKGKSKSKNQTGTPGTLPDSYHVKGKKYPVRKLGEEQYSVPELQALKFHIEAIMAVPLEMFRGGEHDDEGPDAMNDYVSDKLTGDAAALCDIGYTHIPELNYGEGYAAVLVTGTIDGPEDVFEEVMAESERVFYENLGELVDLIKVGQPMNFEVLFQDAAGGNSRFKTGEIAAVDEKALDLLRQYATSRGDTNEAVNAAGAAEVFAVQVKAGEEYLIFKLHVLKYASKTGTDVWTVASRDELVRLHFSTAQA